MSLRKDIHTDLKRFSIAAPIGENIFTGAEGRNIQCSLNRLASDDKIRQQSQRLVRNQQNYIKPVFQLQ
jgi:hypothetical protein